MIIISHLGRPKDEKDTNLSLKPILNYLKDKIDSKVHFYSEKISDQTKNKNNIDFSINYHTKVSASSKNHHFDQTFA